MTVANVESPYSFYLNEARVDARILFPGRSISSRQSICIDMTHTDEQAYSVFSCVQRVPDAIGLMVIGITSRDEALEYLRANSLTDLIVDRRDFVDELMERKVKASTYIDFESWHSGSDQSSPYYIDAIEANGFDGIRNYDLRQSGSGLIKSVLEGAIKLSVIRAIGADLLDAKTGMNYMEGLVHLLFELSHKPKEYCPIEDIKVALYLCLRTTDIYRVNEVAKFPGSGLLLRNLKNIQLLHQLWEYRDDTPEQKVEYIIYADTFELTIPYARKLAPANVAGEFAQQAYSANNTIPVEHIITMYQHGISAAVVEGWI